MQVDFGSTKEGLIPSLIIYLILVHMTILGVLRSFLVFIMALISISFFTLLERKVLGYSQMRKGPNKVGYIGILQPFSDALKLFSKELRVPSISNIACFLISPVLSLILALMLWLLYPSRSSLCVFPFGVLLFFCVSRLRVYSTLGAGWSSNSKYSLLGSLRGIAQTISYEVRMALIILRCLLVKLVLRFNYIYRDSGMRVFLIFTPLFLVWFTTTLAETNRTPFDFAEGESELVSGFNTEYSGSSFALIFMAEYLNIIIIRLFRSLIFIPLLNFSIIKDMILILYTLFFSFIFIWVRGRFPRFRYDQLIWLTWKGFLPFSLCVVILFFGLYVII